MALKSLFSTMKREGYIIQDLDKFLISMEEENDRALNVNAPSQIGNCLRQRYYARLGYKNKNILDARTRRIFDNGTKTHERLQEYLKKQGMLLLDEVPVYNAEYNIQGHTDGILALSDTEKGILEIKSINSNNFSQLKSAKKEHIMQGLVYLYCIEQRRIQLHNRYFSLPEFLSDERNRMNEYASLYPHLKDGSKFTREQKIEFQCGLHNQLDKILMETFEPITKVIFLYENKDNQELKEFCVTSGENEELLSAVLEECALLNEYVENKELPPKEGENKSCALCRWCNYSNECWGK